MRKIFLTIFTFIILSSFLVACGSQHETSGTAKEPTKDKSATAEEEIIKEEITEEETTEMEIDESNFDFHTMGGDYGPMIDNEGNVYESTGTLYDVDAIGGKEYYLEDGGSAYLTEEQIHSFVIQTTYDTLTGETSSVMANFSPISEIIGDDYGLNHLKYKFTLDEEKVIRHIEHVDVLDSGETVKDIIVQHQSHEADYVGPVLVNHFKVDEETEVTIVESTLGKVLVENPGGSGCGGCKITPMYKDEQQIPSDYQTLVDNYNIANNIVFIDFENGKYYYEFKGGEIGQIDIVSGEPLYDGANDKTVRVGPYSSTVINKVEHRKNGSFYIITNSSINLIDNELNLLAETEIPDDAFVGIEDDSIYLGTISEYQRKNTISRVGMYYGGEYGEDW
ncbi:hypothetical protein [Metabacillus endolithicus]|uniref:Lipoprotein n=2 Tax=Metabacillus endolithicus TaxID=1535204 RepID=A0ABW5BXV1_9BACI